MSTQKRIPPFSPFVLLQETVWPSEWKLLVSCIFLNQTSRKQVEKILPLFWEKWSTPELLLNTDRQQIVSLCKPLGFANKRTDCLLKLAKCYLNKNTWSHAKDLPGIGHYGSKSWEIFCLGIIDDASPGDHALDTYHSWRKRYEQRKKNP